MASTELPMIAKVGEERKITIYKSINTMISQVSDVNFIGSGISFGHGALKAFLKGVAPGGSLIYFGTLASWLYEGALKFDKYTGIKGFNITYTYRYEFKYGDPTTLPRWKAIKSTMSPVR
ncbi:MAG: hypothetical protein ACTHWZ_08520 [Peptoniphilaceae bacterium]